MNLKALLSLVLIVYAIAMCDLLPMSGWKANSQAGETSSYAAYLGFDRNDYPGDANLRILRHTFSFVGYWLNVPPGAAYNTWAGKR